jgi:signal transduction histidine kinase
MNLIRSVKKEIEQREQLALLLKQRESLVHLVTHKVKGSFTRSKYIFAELLEGTFGPITPKVKEIVQKGLDSDNEGINTVDLVLNVANQQSGQIKYDMKPLDFKKITAEIIEAKSAQAKPKGIELKTDIKGGNFTVTGDAIWLKEAAQSLVDNAIKYTLRGSVTVKLEKLKDKIIFSVRDSGVGLTAEDKQGLFTEGGRGKDSLKINVDSTGYGLYSTKMIVEAHHGRVWAESAGKDKGSTFYLELPEQN